MRRRRAGAARLALWSAVAALLALGCEAIVASDVPAYTCAGTALDACPQGMFCKGAGCAACETRDVCDHFDNDCDGKADDGPLSDHDGDGFTICGSDPDTEVDVDCDDNNKSVHPHAMEVCNGVDDDCDGSVDDGTICPSGQECVRAKCIDTASACTAGSCTPPKTCDSQTRQCVSPPSVDLGGACANSAECNSHVCGDGSVLGGDFTGKNGSVCTTPCCTSSDCPAGFVCFAPGTGGDYCVRGSALGRAQGGEGMGGASCGSARDCRSGLCGSDGKCLDTCCIDAECTSGASCTLTTATGHAVFQCAQSGSTSRGDGCGSNSDCKSGVCYNYGGPPPFDDDKCLAPCCGSSACGSVDFGFPIGSVPAICYDANSQVDGTFGNDTDAVCIATSATVGSGTIGDACTQGSDCRSTLCLQGTNMCTDVCCVDANCKTAKAPDWVCRPTTIGGGTYLRCVPP